MSLYKGFHFTRVSIQRGWNNTSCRREHHSENHVSTFKHGNGALKRGIAKTHRSLQAVIPCCCCLNLSVDCFVLFVVYVQFLFIDCCFFCVFDIIRADSRNCHRRYHPRPCRKGTPPDLRLYKELRKWQERGGGWNKAAQRRQEGRARRPDLAVLLLPAEAPDHEDPVGTSEYYIA